VVTPIRFSRFGAGAVVQVEKSHYSTVGGDKEGGGWDYGDITAI